MEIKTVYFDMGNTLLHFHEGPSDEEKEAEGLKNLTASLRRYCSTLTEKDVEEGFLIPWQNGLARRKIDRVEYPVEDFLNRFLLNFGVTLELSQCIAVMERYHAPYDEHLVVRPGVASTLERLKEKGFKIGVISNSNLFDEIRIGHFVRAGIAHLIDSFTFSYYLKIMKPREEIFYVAMNRLDALPENSLMVGDLLEVDIAGAKKVGMKTAWLDEGGMGAWGELQPDWTLERISDLKKILGLDGRLKT